MSFEFDAVCSEALDFVRLQLDVLPQECRIVVITDHAPLATRTVSWG